jgi:hypothetical protein
MSDFAIRRNETAERIALLEARFEERGAEADNAERVRNSIWRVSTVERNELDVQDNAVALEHVQGEILQRRETLRSTVRRLTLLEEEEVRLKSVLARNIASRDEFLLRPGVAEAVDLHRQGRLVRVHESESGDESEDSSDSDTMPSLVIASNSEDSSTRGNKRVRVASQERDRVRVVYGHQESIVGTQAHADADALLTMVREIGASSDAILSVNDDILLAVHRVSAYLRELVDRGVAEDQYQASWDRALTEEVEAGEAARAELDAFHGYLPSGQGSRVDPFFVEDDELEYEGDEPMFGLDAEGVTE